MRSFLQTMQDACDIFCHGPLLATLQTTVFAANDRSHFSGLGLAIGSSRRSLCTSKTFVDRPLLADSSAVLAAFNLLPGNASLDMLQAFVDKYFAAEGSDLVNHAPADFNPTPPFLATLTDPKFVCPLPPSGLTSYLWS
jgi:hypothetical protein